MALKLPWFLPLLLSLLSVTGLEARERFCFEENNLGIGLSFLIDEEGRYHISHVKGLGASLNYIRLDLDGSELVEVVSGRIHRSQEPIVDTGIILVDEEPWVCYRNPYLPGLKVGQRNGGEWNVETVYEGAQAGRFCAFSRWGERLLLLFMAEDSLQMLEWRAGAWGAAEVLDALPSFEVGVDLNPVVIQGELYIAHRLRQATQGGAEAYQGDQLRLTWSEGERWRSATIESGQRSGLHPQLLFQDGELVVLHGAVPQRYQDTEIGLDSDLGIFISRGPNPEAMQTQRFIEEPVGGSHAASLDSQGRIQLFIREFSLSALFGAHYSLRLYEGISGFQLGPNHEVIAQSSQQRHTYQRLSAQQDPFGLFVGGFVDSAGPYMGERGSINLCFIRPDDLDGDALPDEIEARLGSDPLQPDSDGDGRGDGQEMLRDDSDPNVADQPGSGRPTFLEPDMGLPDLGIFDAGLPDLALPDQIPLDLAPLDAAPPDLPPLDAAPPDLPPLDAAPPDLPPLDAALPDQVLLDAAPSDFAFFDTAPPDLTRLDTAPLDFAPLDTALLPDEALVDLRLDSNTLSDLISPDLPTQDSDSSRDLPQTDELLPEQDQGEVPREDSGETVDDIGRSDELLEEPEEDSSSSDGCVVGVGDRATPLLLSLLFALSLILQRRSKKA